MNYKLDVIRNMFPALSIKDDEKKRIYFDNPAGTQVSQHVVSAMAECLIESNANIQGGFETSNRADAILNESHQSMADFLNANSSDEIIFGQNMTTLTLHISRSIGRSLSAGDEIILSKMDHDANISPGLLLAEDLDLKIKWLSYDDKSLEFDIHILDAMTGKRIKKLVKGNRSVDFEE